MPPEARRHGCHILMVLRSLNDMTWYSPGIGSEASLKDRAFKHNHFDTEMDGFRTVPRVPPLDHDRIRWQRHLVGRKGNVREKHSDGESFHAKCVQVMGQTA